MTMLTPARVLRRLRSLVIAPHLDDELDEEIRFISRWKRKSCEASA